MRRSSSTTRRWGASSDSEATGAVMLASTARAAAAVGAGNQPQHFVPVRAVDHGGEEASRRLVRAWADLGHRAGNAGGLQPGELERQRLALGGDVEQPLAAVVGAFPLHHVALVDQLLEHPPERLLGDLQNDEQVGNFYARIAVDEVQ